MTAHHRILIVVFPGQGHINPSLQFAKRILSMGVEEVTFCTNMSVVRRIEKQTTHHGLTFAPISENDPKPNETLEQFCSDFATNGAPAVSDIIKSAAASGNPFDHLVYTTIVPWAAGVAKAHGIKSTLLWCQSATILDLYYYYFNGFGDLISCSNKNPSFAITLPGLPPLNTCDLPTFFLPSRPQEHDFAIPLFKDHIDVLGENPRVLISTFNELEVEPIRALKNLELLPVGPLIPSAFLDGQDPSDNSFGGDLFEKSVEDYIKWLNTKPKSSVVYVSFGSMSTLSFDQAEEMANGLLESGRPFLWVIRDGGETLEVSKIEEMKKQGMIVGWCSQVEVLSHQAIGCFVSHCGWNSTVEALAAGVPTVAFPQWTDQGTNAKMIEDVWKTGVRVRKREGHEVVDGKEIERCVKMVMGNEEMRRNAEKWKDLARKAVNNGGSSTINLQAFLDDA
ncbi:UDP-Glycosyltransferase superfamily protein [Artemisia annua]|uniref:Glycosyltransferase n=1 Tax=Artemisia annua TaxID=35608 RepID=A0A2U1LZD4_ARTAN|nr:UDP-Glycosyltransferase superfamily protein [Artemisia annua]